MGQSTTTRTTKSTIFGPKSERTTTTKLQMARNIVQAYTGRVTIEQVLNMTFERVQGLHNEIVSRLNQSNQQHQTQHHPAQQPQQQQHHDYTPNAIQSTTTR